jgi:hypothetical protein
VNRATNLLVLVVVICAAGLTCADVPEPWATRIRDAYVVYADLSFVVEEHVANGGLLGHNGNVQEAADQSDQRRRIRVTVRPGVGVRTDELLPVLSKVQRGMHGVIDRNDGTFSVVLPTPIDAEPKPAKVYFRAAGTSSGASVRIAPVQRGDWILSQFTGARVSIAESDQAVTIQKSDGSVEVVLDRSDLALRSATLRGAQVIRTEVLDFYSRSPMKSKWPMMGVIDYRQPSSIVPLRLSSSPRTSLIGGRTPRWA